MKESTRDKILDAAVLPAFEVRLMTIAEYQNAVLKANQALDIVEDILRALQHARPVEVSEGIKNGGDDVDLYSLMTELGENARLAEKFLQNAYTLAHFDDPIETYGWEQ